MAKQERSKGQPAGKPGPDTTTDPPPRTGWPHMHLWEIQPLRDIVVVLAVLALLYLGYVLRLVTVPLLLALLLAYLFEPVVQWMTRESQRPKRTSVKGSKQKPMPRNASKGMSRPVAAITIIIAAAVLVIVPIVGGLAIGTVEGVKLLRSVGTNLRTVVRFVDTASAPEANESREQLLERQPEEAMEHYDKLPEGLWQTAALEANRRIAVDAETKEAASNWARENAERLTGMTVGTTMRALQTALSTGQTIGVILFSAFLTAFFFFFFSTGFGKVLDFWRELIPENSRDQTIDMIKKMDRVTSAFVRGRLTIMVVQCFVFGLGYWLIGVPAGIVLGIIVGILALFPYVSVIGVPVAILLMFLDPAEGFRGAWWWMILAPIVIYVIGQAIDEYLLTPTIQGKATNMDAPTVLFASIAGGVLAGFYGLLVAIPVAACLKIILIEVVWPRVKAWVKGAVRDPLPVGESKSS